MFRHFADMQVFQTCVTVLEIHVYDILKMIIYVRGCRMHGNESFSQNLNSNTLAYPPTKM